MVKGDLRTAGYWRERAERAQAAFLAAHLAAAPAAWSRRVEKLYHAKKRESWSAADAWIVETAERFRALRVPINLSDSEIVEMAGRCAKEAMALAGVGLMTPEAYRERLERYCRRYDLTVPERVRITRTGSRVGVEDGPAISRMTDALWWRKALRKAQGRALEREAIGLGYVHRRAEIYASDATTERRGQQRKRNAAALEGTDAINLTTGEVYTLAQLAETSVANPKIRRGELMTRIAGFEAVAQGVGHAAEFVTLTAPSRFHAQRQAGPKVESNPAYAGATPRETQSYLVKVWSRVRSALKRAAVAVYGFRIAEPHHDATPHWHLLLFMAAEAVGTFRAIFRRYAIADSPNEPGAAEYRIKFKAIDPAKGSAAGYVAKYVAKNVEGGGYQVQGDIEGHDAIYPSQRVEAWASTWGIRQFQQVGGPPVGVWRELRRMATLPDWAPDVLMHARAAAGIKGEGQEKANWRRYVEVMGGPVVVREDLPLRVAYTRKGERFDVIRNEPVPAPETRYGEEAPGAVYGVRDVRRDRAYVSRVYRWEIRRGACTSVNGKALKNSVTHTRRSIAVGGNIGVSAGGCGGEGSKVLPGAAGPWTGVNNCTRGGNEDGAGIESGRVGQEVEARCRDDSERRQGGDCPVGGAESVTGTGESDRKHGAGHRATRGRQ